MKVAMVVTMQALPQHSYVTCKCSPHHPEIILQYIFSSNIIHGCHRVAMLLLNYVDQNVLSLVPFGTKLVKPTHGSKKEPLYDLTVTSK